MHDQVLQRTSLSTSLSVNYPIGNLLHDQTCERSRRSSTTFRNGSAICMSRARCISRSARPEANLIELKFWTDVSSRRSWHSCVLILLHKSPGPSLVALLSSPEASPLPRDIRVWAAWRGQRRGWGESSWMFQDGGGDEHEITFLCNPRERRANFLWVSFFVNGRCFWGDNPSPLFKGEQPWFQRVVLGRLDCVMRGTDENCPELPTNPLIWFILRLKLCIVSHINQESHIIGALGFWFGGDQNDSFLLNISLVFPCKVTDDSIQWVFSLEWE
jgi:hypothetical protein